MAEINAKKRAGPTGRARIGFALQRRPLGDPRVRRNAAILATNRRTVRGVEPLNLGLEESPPPMVDEQMRRIELKINEIVANMQEREIMERRS